MCTKLKYSNSSQKGVFLIFTALILMAILLLVGMMIDIGRIVITARNLQVAAESASLAGVERLKKCDINNVNSTPLNFDCLPYGVVFNGNGGWQASKAAVIAALTNIKLLGRELGVPNYSTTSSRCDVNDTIDGFGDLRYEQGSFDGLTFRVERLFECVDSITGNLMLLSLENSSYNRPASTYHYCLANALRVTLNYSGHKHMVASWFGMSSNTSITKNAVARIRPKDIALSCNFPSCDLMNSATTLCNPTC
jgi:hypothetical protein